MSTWEERMSAKAKARQVVQEAEEAARYEAEMAELRAELEAAFPALPGEGDVIVSPGRSHPLHYHHGHRTHGHGWITICSCGATLTVAAFVFDPDAPPRPPCPICETRGNQS